MAKYRMIYRMECQECGWRSKNWLSSADARDEARSHEQTHKKKAGTRR